MDSKLFLDHKGLLRDSKAYLEYFIPLYTVSKYNNSLLINIEKLWWYIKKSSKPKHKNEH